MALANPSLVEFGNVSGSEGADDPSLADITTCMTNTIKNVSCAELKYDNMTPTFGAIRLVCGIDPSTIDTGATMELELSIESTMTAGKVSCAPYTDANSISLTNEVLSPEIAGAGDFSIVLTAAMIAELGDLGGGTCAFRIWAGAAEAPKPNVSEVQYDLSVSGGGGGGLMNQMQSSNLGNDLYNGTLI